MKVERVHEGVRYTLSNEGLKTNDKVFPIAFGRCFGAADWILHGFDFSEHFSGFPNEPHTIIDLEYNKNYKPYEVKTNNGFGPIEIYYKITKMEQRVVEDESALFKTYKWIEMTYPVSLNQTTK